MMVKVAIGYMFSIHNECANNIPNADPIRWAYTGNESAIEIEALLKLSTGLVFKMVPATNDNDVVQQLIGGNADLGSPDLVTASVRYT